MTKILRNVTRLLQGSNSSGLALAPTGCATALIEEKTHYRSCLIQTGKKFQKRPKNLSLSDPKHVQTMRVAMCLVITWFMDEHSMVGRAFFAWLKHRSEELRRPIELLNENNETFHLETSSLYPEIYNML